MFGTLQHLFDSFPTSSRKCDYQFVQVYFNVAQLAKGRQNMSIIVSVLVESFHSCLSAPSPTFRHFPTLFLRATLSHWVQPIGETKEASVRQARARARARPSSNHGQEGGATLLYCRHPPSSSYTQPPPLWVLWSVCVVMCVNKFNFRLSLSPSLPPSPASLASGLKCRPTRLKSTRFSFLSV